MNDLSELTKTEKVDELLVALDHIARDVDFYEYGLPLFDEGDKARLQKAVLDWLLAEVAPNGAP